MAEVGSLNPFFVDICPVRRIQIVQPNHFANYVDNTMQNGRSLIINFDETDYRVPRKPGPYDPREEERRVTLTPNSVKFRYGDGPIVTVEW